MPATPQKSTSHRWKMPAGQQICLWLEHAPQQPHPQRGGKNEVEERPGEALTTGGDEMTPGELTGKWREKNGQQQTQFLYLSTSESEESLSSDLEAEEEQEREGSGGKRKGLTTLRKDRRVTDKKG